MARSSRSKRVHKRASDPVAKVATPPPPPPAAIAEIPGASTSAQQRSKNNTVAQSSQKAMTELPSHQLAQLAASSSFQEIDFENFDTCLNLSSTITESSANSSVSTQSILVVFQPWYNEFPIETTQFLASRSEPIRPHFHRFTLPFSSTPSPYFNKKNDKMPSLMMIVQPHGLRDFLSATGIDHPDGTHCWLSEWGMKLNEIMPCLPEPYEADGLAGKAVYILGVPNIVKIPVVASFLACYGRVVKTPFIIDMDAENTFRWAIMGSAAEADNVVDKLHGSLFMGRRLQVCKAMNTNDDRRFPDVYTDEQFFAGEFNPTAQQLKLLRDKAEREAKEEMEKDAKIKGKAPAVRPVVPEFLPFLSSPAAHDHQSPLQPPASQFIPQTQPGPSVAHPHLPSQSFVLQSEMEELSTVVPEIATAEFRSQAVSWAAIATSSSDKSKTIDLNPERKTTSAAPRLQPIGRIPSISITQPHEPMIEQMRVVFILNLPTKITLQDISDAIIEGPLVSIRFGIDANDGSRYAGIIFQFATDAETFYQVLCKERVDAKPVRFRFITEVVRGEAFPSDDVIAAMGASPYASRRLTIVKSRFFFIFGERHLRNLCDKAVGADNVQLIWLYNGGNATVVFAEVAAAMKIKKILDKMRDDEAEKGIAGAVWEGLQTTYSKDPCIQPLRLETVMRD